MQASIYQDVAKKLQQINTDLNTDDLSEIALGNIDNLSVAHVLSPDIDTINAIEIDTETEKTNDEMILQINKILLGDDKIGDKFKDFLKTNSTLHNTFYRIAFVLAQNHDLAFNSPNFEYAKKVIEFAKTVELDPNILLQNIQYVYNTSEEYQLVNFYNQNTNPITYNTHVLQNGINVGAGGNCKKKDPKIIKTNKSKSQNKK